jgi:dehydrogenase/reductase SDR family protein 1
MQITARGGKGIAVYCDHADEKDIKALFERIDKENNGQLDILVNNAYAAVNVRSARGLTGQNALFSRQFRKILAKRSGRWTCPCGMKSTMSVYAITISARKCTCMTTTATLPSVYAARLMVPRRQGLIVMVSSPGGMRYLFNVAYGIGKAAVGG